MECESGDGWDMDQGHTLDTRRQNGTGHLTEEEEELLKGYQT
jgi:hypothetical protein